MFDTNNSVLVLLAGLCAAGYLWQRKNSKLPLPPGPPGHWLFGNKFPSGITYQKFEELTQEYGPIFYLRRGFTDVIVIGTHEAAVDIMEKEGASLVDRPRSIAVQETLCRDMRLLMMRSGPRFKKYRKVFQTQLHQRAIEPYRHLQLKNAVNYVLDILRDPSHHQDHARRYAASVIITLTYGKESATDYSDPQVQQILAFAQRFGTAVKNGQYLVDTFPIMKHIPGYLSDLNKWHREELAVYTGYVDAVKEQMAVRETPPPSFVKNIVDNQTEFGLSDAEISFMSGGLFLAGADTTASAISIMAMAAACYPDAQAKVQEQLDAVVGRHRYPTFEDEDQLIEVSAFVLESFRWRPVSANGFPHRATKEIIWRGYRIPAGATVIGNQWSIARSPDVFPDPDRFDPQRWIAADGTLRDDLKSFGFGFGRRVCPGQNLANRSLFATTAFLLWAFKVSQDPNEPIDRFAFSKTVNLHPLPYKARFEPRIPTGELEKILAQ